MTVTKQIKKTYEAYLCAVGLILCQVPNGWSPLDLGLRAWLCHPKNVEKRRLDPRSGSDSSWTMKRLTNEPYTVMIEMFEMIIKAARMVVRIAGASPRSLERRVLKWLDSEEAHDTIHPVTRDFLRVTPSAEIQCLSAICSIAIQDAEAVIEKLKVIRAMKRFNAYQTWALIAKVLKLALESEVSWLVPMEDQCVLADARATRPLEQNKIAMLTNIVDKDELLRDDRVFNAADNAGGYSKIAKIMGSEMGKQLVQMHKAQNRRNIAMPVRDPNGGGGGKPERKQPAPDSPAGLRLAMHKYIKEHNASIKKDRCYEICAVFAMGRTCTASDDGGKTCSGRRFAKKSKKRVNHTYHHRCLCTLSDKSHSIVSCDKWHSK